MNNILDSITDGFTVLDKNWCWTYVNKKAEEFARLNKNQMIGKSIWSIWPDLVGHKIWHEFHRAMQERIDVHFEILDSEYDGRSYEYHVYPFEDGISVYMRDITEKHMEAAFFEGKAIFKSAFEYSPSGMGLLNKEGWLIEVNPALSKMLGYSENELINKKISEITYDEDVWQTLQSLNDLLEGKIGFYQIEKRYVHKLGHLVHVLVTGSLVKDEADRPLYYFGQIQDLTEQKRIEREMINFERLSVAGKMAAGIGHEIRNPMTVVRGFLQILSKKDEYADTKSVLELMISELDRANSIITEFLSLTNNKPVELKKHNLNVIIENIAPLLLADAVKMGNI